MTYNSKLSGSSVAEWNTNLSQAICSCYPSLLAN